MKYSRVYTDEDGETHFDDGLIEFSPAEFAPPAPPLNVSTFMGATSFGYVQAPPGWYGEWHPTPKRQVFVYLTGQIEAEVSDGEVRVFGPGSITLLEDTTGKGHRSRVVGEQEVLCVVIQLKDQENQT